MRSAMISLMNAMVYPCKNVAGLLIKQEDQRLDPFTRMRIRAHISMCKGCGNFEGQILTMRNSLKAWRHYEES